MIISASRRCDIPAFKSEWFFERMEKGFVDVPNPMNPHLIRRVPLSRDDVDCIVFWTKNPSPMLPSLDRLDGYPFYFQYTLNSYDCKIETGVPPYSERIDTFLRLSELIGPERVLWRYDPIILCDGITPQIHLDAFANTARALNGATNRVTVSFVDYYRRIGRAWKLHGMREPLENEIAEIASGMASVASECGMEICSCAEKYPLQSFGIAPAHCVDASLVSKITGKTIPARRAASQRSLCGCDESADIGEYGVCAHGCAYCYARRG